MAQWVVYRVIVQFGNRKVAEAIQWSWRINYLAVSTSPQSRTPWVGHEAEWEMKSQRWRARENRKLFFANMSHSDSVFMHVQTKPLWGLCIFRPSICPADLLAHPPHSGTTFACGGSCHWLPAVSRMCHLLNHPIQGAAAIKNSLPLFQAPQQTTPNIACGVPTRQIVICPFGVWSTPVVPFYGWKSSPGLTCQWEVFTHTIFPWLWFYKLHMLPPQCHILEEDLLCHYPCLQE